MCLAPSSVGTSSLFFYWDQWMLRFCNPGCLLGRMIYTHCIKKKHNNNIVFLKALVSGWQGGKRQNIPNWVLEVRRQAPCEGCGRAPALAPQAQGRGAAFASAGV